jgi:hypothetical protein
MVRFVLCIERVLSVPLFSLRTAIVSRLLGGNEEAGRYLSYVRLGRYSVYFVCSR